jgi:hypothetical protein
MARELSIKFNAYNSIVKNKIVYYFEVDELLEKNVPKIWKSCSKEF